MTCAERAPALVTPLHSAADTSDSSTTLTQAFLEADEVLHAGVRGISDIITVSALTLSAAAR